MSTIKRFVAFFVVAVFSATVLVGAAQAKISLGVDAAGQFQAIESTEGDGTDMDESAGFASNRANLHIYGDVADGVDVYTEVYLNPSTEHAPVDDAGDLRFSEGYIMFTDLPVDVTAGSFEIDFGDQHLYRSDNGQVMDNPLVGNHLVDPRGVQNGVEISGNATQSINYALAVTNGVQDLQGTLDSDDNSQFTAEDSNLAYTAKVWGELAKGFRTSASFYRSDQSEAIEAVQAGGNNGNNLRSNVFGPQHSVYQGLMATGRVDRSTPPSDVTHPTVGVGENVTAYQVDAKLTAIERLTLRANYGNVEDERVTGSTAQDWDYYSVEAVRDLTPRTHVAARYGSAENSEASPNTEFEKIQVGAGYEWNENTTLKAEWVDQSNETSGSEAGFDGFITEVGVSF